nr:MAG TPA: hypothetical protein [Bacteriophage sp.]
MLIHSAPPFSYHHDTKNPSSQTARKLPVFCPQTALKNILPFLLFPLDFTLILAYNRDVNKRGGHPRRIRK